LIGPPTLFGGATGSLAESVVLTDTSVLNFVVQQFTPGASLTFTIVVAAFNEEEGEIPDGIAFAILDSSGTPVPTTAPAGDYLASLELTPNGVLTFYGSDVARSPFTGDPLTITRPTVRSNIPPVLFLPGPTEAEATGVGGASVNYTASATDVVDGIVDVTCAPASGVMFPLGTTTVQCSATDTSGNTSDATFVVTVVDTTAPVITPIPELTVEATGASGAIVTFASPMTSDAVDGVGRAACLPSSGSVFRLDDTTVTCSAHDAAGNSSSETFRITVRDTTAPRLTLPEAVTRDATGPAGAIVDFAATASDLVDGDGVDGTVPVNCVPRSGTTFSIGVTTVLCEAVDSHANRTSGTFTITVRNHAPIAAADAAATLENVPVTIPVLANDTDVDGGALVVTGTTTAGHGNVSLGGDGSVSYTPAHGYYGSDTFTYTLSDGQGGTAVGSVTLTVSRLGRFVAFGVTQARFRSRSLVITGDVGANRPVGDSRPRQSDDADGDDRDGSIEVRIGEQVSMLQPGSRVVGDTVWLRDGASVYDVAADELINRGAVVLGAVTTPVTQPFVALPALPVISPGSTDVVVAVGTTRTLQPGKYRRIHVRRGGTLILTGGLYQVMTMDVDGQATVLFRAASELRIKGELDTDAQARVGIDPTVAGLTASSVLILVEAADGNCQHDSSHGWDGDDGGQAAVHFGADNVIQANVYAPNGQIWVKARTVATGAFIGARVRIGEQVRLTLDSAFK
jgi:hypothetical protein